MVSLRKQRRMQRRQRRRVAVVHADSRALAVSPTRILLARGTPEFFSLQDALLRCDLSSFTSMGYAKNRASEVTVAELERRRDWSRASSREKSNRCYQEFLAAIRECDWNESGNRAHQPIMLLTSSERLCLRQAIAEECGDRRLSSEMSRAASVVFWLAGETPLRRFVKSMQPFCGTREREEYGDLLRGFLKHANKWKDMTNRGEIDAQMRSVIRHLPPALCEEVGLEPPRRLRDAAGHVKIVIKRCTDSLEKHASGLPRRVACAAAALVVCDGGAVVIPQRMLDPMWDGSRRSGEEIARTMDHLTHYSHRRGYDAMLRAMGAIDREVPTYQYHSLRSLLLAGGTGADWCWLIDAAGDEDLPCFKLSPQPLQEFLSDCGERGIEWDREELGDLCRGVRTNRDLTLLRSLRKWLLRLPNGIARNRAKTLKVAFTAMLKRSSAGARMLSWAKPPKGLRALPAGGEKFPADSQRWLKQTRFYLRLADERNRVPKSLNEWVTRTERERKEFAYLTRRQAEGNLNESSKQRLRLLSQHRDRQLQPRRLLREVQKNLVDVAATAARHLLLKEAKAWWQREMPEAPMPSPERVFEFAGWVPTLSATERANLHAIMRTWSKHGRSYRRHLPQNEQWLRTANEAGVRLDEWLLPPATPLQWRGADAVIEVSGDPVEIFLMGTCFDTCLALDEGCNRNAVLANAYHANKAVLYVRDRSQRILARKLIAISRDMTMVGYHTYCNVPESQRDMLIDEIGRYCGRWARRANVRLSDEGVPEDLCDLFWYDDGEVAWPSAAYSAWMITGMSAPSCQQAVGKAQPTNRRADLII